MNYIKLQIPKDLTALDLQDYFQELADEEESDLHKILKIDLSHIDSRASFDNICINEVILTETEIHIHYEIEYSIYNGCSDLNIDETVELCASGIVIADDGTVQINKQEIPTPRSTIDEF